MQINSSSHVAQLTVEIVGPYVENNPVAAHDLADLIGLVSRTLSGLRTAASAQQPEPVPAVNPGRWVFPDYIVSLEDGKKYRLLKRHLSRLGLTPEEYPRKWNLADHYPMVAPNHGIRRSEIAKQMGLGRTPLRRRSEAPGGKSR